MNTHDYTMIDGKQVLHSTATRDYICADCGSGLITLFKDGEWKTECADDETHKSFVTKREWARIQTDMMIRAEVGREVFANLPPEIQKMLKGE